MYIYPRLSTLKDFVTAELARSKLTPDPLLLRQREGFQAANPARQNPPPARSDQSGGE